MAKNAVNYTGLIPETGDSFESATQNTTGSLDGIDIRLGELDGGKQDFTDESLNTTDKTIVGAINEINTNKLKNGGYVGTGQDLKNAVGNKYTFDTIADAQDYEDFVEGDIVEVLGYYEKGDGGFHQRKAETVQYPYSIVCGDLFLNPIPLFTNEIFSSWYGVVENEDMTSMLNILTSYYKKGEKIRFSSGNFIFSDTINITNGNSIIGTMIGGQTAWNNNLNNLNCTKFIFQPDTPKTALQLSEYSTNFNFINDNSIKGIWLYGDETENSSIGIDFSKAYYNSYEDIRISGFDTGLKAYGTINNNFKNIHITRCGLCIDYGNISTTDVWDNLVLNQSEKGINFSQSTVNIRFNNIIAEQIQNIGFELDTSCSEIVFDKLYTEDIPFSPTYSDPCVFKVGINGTLQKSSGNLVINNSLIKGNNASELGSFIYCDVIDGIKISDTMVRKFSTVFNTGANTLDRAISLSNFSFSTCTTFANNTLKLQGNWRNRHSDPNTYETHSAKIIKTKEIQSESGSTLIAGGVAIGISNFYPNSDNSMPLGVSNARWSVIYAGTGIINTSDDREKTYLDISEKEILVAKELKLLMKKFKFNNAIDEKGLEKARIHFGTSAQSVKEVFEKYGLNAFDYALLCYDEWEEEKDEEENIIREAGNRYGIRYEELLCFIISSI